MCLDYVLPSTQCEIELRTPPNAIVGKYSLNVNIGEDYDYRPEHSHFYLLFNPWCKGKYVRLQSSFFFLFNILLLCLNDKSV